MPIIHGTPELVCPKCGNNSKFQSLVLVPALIDCKRGGIEELYEDEGIGLMPDVPCVCMACDYASIVAEFAGLPEDVESDGSFVVTGQEGNA